MSQYISYIINTYYIDFLINYLSSYEEFFLHAFSTGSQSPQVANLSLIFILGMQLAKLLLFFYSNTQGDTFICT